MEGYGHGLSHEFDEEFDEDVTFADIFIEDIEANRIKHWQREVAVDDELPF
jgi:hypothetical protein